MSVSFYRKWRPAKFEDLDIESVRKFFGGVIKSGKFAQAYLFSGPKGTGKTSASRILAMALNCEKNDPTGGKLGEPCGKCELCVSIKNGTSPAVVEIDAASNRGIDDIRELRERVGLVPAVGNYSVFIIDEVHMLTREAFNALLKTLEEPPKHVVFCLATTEEHKLPDTIVSRCTKVAYRKATTEEVVGSLQRVVKGEGLKVESGALEAIASVADGSFRDAVKVLEQLAPAGKITVSRVEEEVSGGGLVEVKKLYGQMIAGDAQAAMETVEKMETGGADMKVAAKLLVEQARVAMRGAILAGEEYGVEKQMIEVVSKSFSRFADVPVTAIALEMAVVEYCLGSSGSTNAGGNSSKKVVQISEMKNQKSKVKSQSDKLESKDYSTDEVVESVVPVDAGDQESGLDLGDSKGEGDNEIETNGRVEVDLTTDEVRSQWPQVLSEVSKLNHGLLMVLKGARIEECVGDKLVLSVSYKFHKDQLLQDKYLSAIETATANVLGGKLKLAVELSKGRRVPKKVAEVHENIAAVPAKDSELVEAAEEIFG